MVRNKTIVLNQNPTGYPVPGQDLVVMVGYFNLRGGPPQGGITVKTIYVSLDPHLRVRISETGLLPLMQPIRVGTPLLGISIAKVVITRNLKFKRGDMIVGLLPIQQYSIIKSRYLKFYAPIYNPYRLELPFYLGALGIPGLVAIASLDEVDKSNKDGTMFISSAAGAVGHFAGQLAMSMGMVTIIGSVGTDEKLDYIVNELEFNGGFNYKKEKPLDALRRLAPDGIDLYFDNVGGEQLDAALEVMNENGRILCCGMISDYNKSPDEKYGIKNLKNIVSKQLNIQGFSIIDVLGRLDITSPDLSFLIQDDLYYEIRKTKSHVIYGIENGPEGFLAMLKGEHIGNTVLKISDE